MIHVSWQDAKAAHPELFERLVASVAKRHGVDRTSAIDILDEEYTISAREDGTLMLEHDESGEYRASSVP